MGWGTTICHPCSSHSVTVYSSGQCEHRATGSCAVAKAGLFRQDSSKRPCGLQVRERDVGGRQPQRKWESKRRMRLDDTWTTLSSGPLFVPLIALSRLTNPGLFSEPTPDIRQLPLRRLPSHDSLPFSRELWILSRVFLMRSAVSLAEGFWYQHSFISFTRAERVWERRETQKVGNAVIHPQWEET